MALANGSVKEQKKKERKKEKQCKTWTRGFTGEFYQTFKNESNQFLSNTSKKFEEEETLSN